MNPYSNTARYTGASGRTGMTGGSYMTGVPSAYSGGYGGGYIAPPEKVRAGNVRASDVTGT